MARQNNRNYNIYGTNQNYEGNFTKLSPDNIISNSYVVLKSALDPSNPEGFLEEQSFLSVIQNFSSKKGDTFLIKVKNHLEKLIDQSSKNEESFLKLLGKKDGLSSDKEKIKAFMAYLDLQEFYVKRGKKQPYVETLINAQAFRDSIIDSLILAVQNNQITENTSREDCIKIIINGLKGALKKQASDFFSGFDRSNKRISQDLEWLYGKDHIDNIINTAREKSLSKADYKKELQLQKGKTEGFLTEYATSVLKSALSKLKNVKSVKIENTGTETIGRKRFIRETIRIQEDEEIGEINLKRIGLGKKVKVAQKADNIATIELEDEEGLLLTYKIYISNKFRKRMSFNDEETFVNLQGGSPLNTQIPQLEGILRGIEGVSQKELLSNLMFAIVNTTRSSIFEGEKREVEEFLRAVSAAYMFDNIAKETFNESSHGIFLFQLNIGVVPLSVILKSLLEEVADQSYLQVNINHVVDPKQVYENELIKIKSSPEKSRAHDRAIYLRNAIIVGDTASSLNVTFNHNLLANAINANTNLMVS